jgi:hypothetical protein
VTTGARRGELCALHWSQVRLPKGFWCAASAEVVDEPADRL